MRQLISPLLALLLWIPTHAQEAKRYVLIEHFTNTRCSICSFRNPPFFEAISLHEQDVHHIAFHPSFPYSSCVFYQHNTTENQDRALFYSVPGTPTTYLWGNRVSNGSGLLPGNTLENALNQTSPIDVIVTEALSGAGRNVNIQVKTVGELPMGGDYRLYAAVVEKLVQYSAPNGEDEHHNVFRKMLPASEGESIMLAAEGGEVNLSYNYDFHPDWDITQMYVIAYVQDINTNEILNSGSSLDVRTTAIDPELDQKFSVFPNPSSSLLHIDWQGIQGQVAQATLLSTTGQTIQTHQVSAQAEQLTLDVSDIPSGLYLVRLDLDGRQVIRKVSVE